MAFWSSLIGCAAAIRNFFAPRYRPEQHYMRGPGPACARQRDVVSTGARITFQ
ncbi:hypothetical protein [Aquibium sp. ELW1220]|jgi:hypothetical protein|uniref:hypothetical protein n=1 Tax=Aquibium sp. ELW1220 TaxID=2976766 RepID=UPI0025AF1495|nr:hypothetical protein [Aquibium sp. ELW1220]MDN2579593.1 hypothetical protein [Aquibium sp. ELW1220]